MSINTVRLSGKQVCDYIYVLNRKLHDDEIALVSDYAYEPEWSTDTVLLNTFVESLLAGNINNGSSAPTSWKIYRQEVGNNTFTIAARLDDSASSFIDYNIRNNKQYFYQLAAETSSYIAAPLLSETISTNWATWCLFDVDSTDERDAYKLHSTYIFAYDVAGGQLSNNMQQSVFPNFTRYPKVHQATTNYYSGTLQSLLGYTDPDTDEYIDNVDIESALNEFTTNSRKKFLKDVLGHIWEVKITSFSVAPRENLIQMPCDVQIGWMVIGSADGLILTD